MRKLKVTLAAIIAVGSLWGCGTTYQGGSSGGHTHIVQKAQTADVHRR